MTKVGKVIGSSKTYKNDRPVYSVTNSNKYGTFTSTVSPCEEDMESISDFVGYGLCERKNLIKTLHRKAIMLGDRYDGVLHAYNALYESWNMHGQLEAMNTLWHQMDVQERLYDEAYAIYKQARDGYREYADKVIQKHQEDKKHAEEFRVKLAEKKAIDAIKELHDIVTEE